MSAETEASTPPSSMKLSEAEANQSRPWRRWATNTALFAGLTGVAINSIASRASDSFRQLSHTNELQDVAHLAVTSGAHPILGFASGLSARYFAEKTADAGKKAYVYLALGMVGTAAADIGVEYGQDYLINPVQPFHAPVNMGETQRDMAAAVLGFAIATAVNLPRRPNKAEQTA